MKTAPIIVRRLAELEAKIDPILFGKVWDPQTQSMIDDRTTGEKVAAAAGGAAVVGGLGVGGYYAHKAIQKAGGYQAVGKRMAGFVGDAAGDVADGIKSRAAAAATGVKQATAATGAYVDRAKVGDLFRRGADTVADTVGGAVERGRGLVVKGAESAGSVLKKLLSKAKGVALDDQRRLLELDARLDAALSKKF